MKRAWIFLWIALTVFPATAAFSDPVPDYYISGNTDSDIFEDFETGFAADSGVSATHTTEITPKCGTKTLKVTGTSSGSGIKTVSLDLSTAGHIGMWVYVPDPTTTTGVYVYLANTWATDYYFAAGGSSIMNNHLRVGWNFVTANRSSFSVVGTPAWTSTFTRIRVRLDGVGPVYFDCLRKGVYTRPKVLLTFDDSWPSIFSVAYAYMQPRGIPGSFMLSRFMQEVSGGSGNGLTLAQIRTMQANGWAIINHGYDHINSSTATEQELVDEFRQNEEWMASLGFDGSKFAAYPGGGVTGATDRAMARLGYLLVRAGEIYAGANGYPMPANAAVDKYIWWSFGVAEADTCASATARIDSAIKNGQTVPFLFHQIGEDGYLTTAVFQCIVDYIVRKKDQIDAVNMTDWYYGLSGVKPTKIN